MTDLESVLVGQAQDLQDDVVPEAAQAHLAGVDVPEEVLEGAQRGVLQLDLGQLRLLEAAEEQRPEVV